MIEMHLYRGVCILLMGMILVAAVQTIQLSGVRKRLEAQKPALEEITTTRSQLVQELLTYGESMM